MVKRIAIREPDQDYPVWQVNILASAEEQADIVNFCLENFGSCFKGDLYHPWDHPLGERWSMNNYDPPTGFEHWFELYFRDKADVALLKLKLF